MRAVAAQKDVCNFCVTKKRKLRELKDLQHVYFKRFDMILVTQCATIFETGMIRQIEI